jgi:predicted MFS family arabinose efflux permease
MFNSASLNYMAFLDLVMIVVFYIVLSFVFKLANKGNEQSETSPRWIKLHLFFKRYHLFKILYLIAAFFIIQMNLSVLSETIIENTTDLEKFMKLHLLIMGNAVVLMGVFFTSTEDRNETPIIKNVHL